MIPLLVLLALVALIVGLATAFKWLIFVAIALVVVAVVRNFFADSRNDL